jgi:MFS family permease
MTTDSGEATSELGTQPPATPERRTVPRTVAVVGSVVITGNALLAAVTLVTTSRPALLAEGEGSLSATALPVAAVVAGVLAGMITDILPRKVLPRIFLLLAVFLIASVDFMMVSHHRALDSADGWVLLATVVVYESAAFIAVPQILFRLLAGRTGAEIFAGILRR